MTGKDEGMDLGRLIARTVIGGLFVGHGTQKLFGWFGGPGLEGTGQMMDKLEMRPPRHHALAASVAETAGGALVALGAALPLAAAVLNGSMFTAVSKVHLDKGPWNTSGGYEYNLVLIAALTALVEAGPGRPSVDGDRLKGTGWALAALAAGAAGSAAAIQLGRQAGDEEEPEPRRRFARETGEVPSGATA
jgi:putative oxidoreductase